MEQLISMPQLLCFRRLPASFPSLYPSSPSCPVPSSQLTSPTFVLISPVSFPLNPLCSVPFIPLFFSSILSPNSLSLCLFVSSTHPLCFPPFPPLIFIITTPLVCFSLSLFPILLFSFQPSHFLCHLFLFTAPIFFLLVFFSAVYEICLIFMYVYI